MTWKSFFLSPWICPCQYMKEWWECTAKLTTLDSIKLQIRWVPSLLGSRIRTPVVFSAAWSKNTVLRDHEKRWKWKKTWVQLSLCVQVHSDQSLLHFKMAECEPVPLQPSSYSTVSWQPWLRCFYSAGLVQLRSVCLQWICQLSPLTLLWFISQSWFGSEEMNSCQLKPNEMCSSHLQAYSPYQTEINLNQIARIHVECTPLAPFHSTEHICSPAQTASTHSTVQCWGDHSFQARISLWQAS